MQDSRDEKSRLIEGCRQRKVTARQQQSLGFQSPAPKTIRLMGPLKRELVIRIHYATRAEARRAMFEWIKVFYNRQRPHSSQEYRSPADHEAAAQARLTMSPFRMGNTSSEIAIADARMIPWR